MTTDKNNNIRIIITGGGTGGHVFPAISIANALRQINPKIDILFVGALKRIEMEKVPAAGYPIIGLPIEGLNRKKILKNFRTLILLIKSILKAKKIIKHFNPHAVIGVGGYASAPVLWQAFMLKIPIYIQEQNSYAGFTNRLMASKSKRIFVAFHNMEKYFPSEKIILTGNPIRSIIFESNVDKTQIAHYYGLDPTKKTILCLGGSLGALSINESIKANLYWFSKLQNIQLIWQCGKTYYPKLRDELQTQLYNNIYLVDFINDIDKAYNLADIIISRAGACTISELCLIGKPVILVPSPNVAEDHQTKNALSLEKKNAAIVINDKNIKKYLLQTAVKLAMDTEKCNKLSNNIKSLAMPNSANTIANIILTDILQNFYEN